VCVGDGLVGDGHELQLDEFTVGPGAVDTITGMDVLIAPTLAYSCVTCGYSRQFAD
jgi:hypothetical protein